MLIAEEKSTAKSFLHRWDPRLKLISLMVLIFAFAYIQKLLLLPVIILISGLLFISSNLSLSYWLNRMRLPAFFLVFMVLVLVFFAGDKILFKLGPLAIREDGLFLALLIFGRFVAIMTVMIVLFGTSPIVNLVKAMASLGLPLIMADMTLFTYRYLFEISRDLQTMQTAMRVRGFKNRRFGSFSYLASLAGAILVRSYDQSDLVYSAMTLRGYGQPSAFKENFQAQAKDFIGLVLIVALAAALVIAQIYIP